MIYIGWNPDTLVLVAGLYGIMEKSVLWVGNAPASWLPEGHKGSDTLCFDLTTIGPLIWSCDPPCGMKHYVSPGSSWEQSVWLAAPCEAIGHGYYVIGKVSYADSFDCRLDCVDPNDPNIRPSDGKLYYSSDTLVVWVVSLDPSICIEVDSSVTLIERGQPAAHVPFYICNPDICAEKSLYAYRVRSRGYIGSPIDQSRSLYVGGGPCETGYAILDATFATACTFDTLSIDVWRVEYPFIADSKTLVVHIIEPRAVPLLRLPVLAILALALVFVAALFVHRRVMSGT
jgi:hypothetical protein